MVQKSFWNIHSKLYPKPNNGRLQVFIIKGILFSQNFGLGGHWSYSNRDKYSEIIFCRIFWKKKWYERKIKCYPEIKIKIKIKTKCQMQLIFVIKQECMCRAIYKIKVKKKTNLNGSIYVTILLLLPTTSTRCLVQYRPPHTPPRPPPLFQNFFVAFYFIFFILLETFSIASMSNLPISRTFKQCILVN